MNTAQKIEVQEQKTLNSIKGLSVQEALKQSQLDWKVELHPILSNNEVRKEFNGIIRKDTNEMFGISRGIWKPFQNKQAFKFFDSFVENKMIELDSAGSFDDGRKIWVLARMISDPIVITKGDEVQKYLLLTNAHDGITGVRVYFTPIRLVCLNMLNMLNRTESPSIRIVHSIKLQSTLENAKQLMHVANKNFDETAKLYKSLVHTSIKDVTKYFEDVFLTQELRKKKTERRHRAVEKALELYETGKGSNILKVKGSLWGAYNAVTEYVDHYSVKDDTRLKYSREGLGKSIKERALSLAFKMV